MLTEFYAGQQHRAPYPFIRTQWEAPPDDPEATMPNMQESWRPGVEHENISQYEDAYCYANGVGEVVFTVIGVFKPGSFPTRVFFTREWIDPEGKKFGRNKLRVTTQQQFRKLVKGYPYAYEIEEQGAAA